jgi:alkylhydroperoxidase family enzyme
VIDENFGPLLKADSAFVMAARQVAPGARLATETIEQIAKAYTDWAEARREAYAEHGTFIADRWEADLLACWLSRFSGTSLSVDSHTARLLRDMQDKAKQIDFVFVTPMEPPFAIERSRNEAGLAREQSLTRQLAYYAWVDALARRFTRARVIELPRESSAKQRQDFVGQIVSAKGGGLT